jgi:hypothetical protein
MGRSRPKTGLSVATMPIAAVAVAVAMSGCTSSPGWASRAATPPVLTTPSPGASAAPDVAADSPGQGASAPVREPLPYSESADPQAMHEIIAEIQELGDLDPASRDELLANLQQTDPRLWPLVAQQVRATLAFRRQAAERATAAASADAGPSGPSRPSAALGQTDRRPADPMADAAPPPGSLRREAGFAPYGRQYPPASGAAVGDRGPAQRSSNARPDGPLPSQELASRAPLEHQGAQSPDGAEAVARVPNHAADATAADGDWQANLEQAIRSLESDATASPESDSELTQQARLRMLYLLDGQRDEALRPIPSMPPAMQEFWSAQLYGLASLMESEWRSESSRRKAEAKDHLDASVRKLGESCPLVVRNLAFATDIQSYGTYKPFDKYEFAPGQRVLLYAEVENFRSTETPKGFFTATRSSYQIFDSSGRRVAEHEFSPSEEYCRQPRRDFFISYDFCLPQRIYPGKHVLQLTVADTNSQKIGQSSIDFTVKSTGD